jgi:uncharacterized membrane protein YidH (DUF202 family)
MNLTDGSTVKKFTYICIGIFLVIISGSALSGAFEFHNVISNHIQRFDSFPESGWLVMLGSVLIFGATIMRRIRAARATR